MAGLSAFKNKQPVGWFKLESGQSKQVFIPTELANMTRAVVHSSPSDFTKSAICTWSDQDSCYACQQGTFQWAGRVKIFIPVYHNNVVSVFPQGTGANSLFWPLAEEFQENKTSVGWFEVGRMGNGKRSKYSAKRIDRPFPIRYNSTVDLRNHLHKIDYSQQQKYYS